MTTGDVVYSLRFSLIKILPEPGFDLGSTAGESCVLTARLHMLLDAKQHYNNFYDCVTEKSFFPQITLPTRIQNESYTLIDNIFTNDIEKSIKSKSGILINDISDHKIIFTFQENLSYIEKTEKYIYILKNMMRFQCNNLLSN